MVTVNAKGLFMLGLTTDPHDLFYWLIYLLRTPFFELYSKTPLLTVTNKMSRIPIFGLFFGNLADLVVALQTHYFYTCAN